MILDAVAEPETRQDANSPRIAQARSAREHDRVIVAPGSRVRLPMMRLEGIQAGDIVEVDRLGRRFHALVGGSADGGLSIDPLDRRVTYRTCRPHEVRAHWAKRGRPRVISEPLEPSALQLELDTP